MKRLQIISIAFILLLLLTVESKAKDYSYADAVTFLGTEKVAQVLKRAVFAVQVIGDQSNQIKDDDWISFGTGFFVKGKQEQYLGITCRHVINAAQKSKKQLYVGIDTEQGYQRFRAKLLHLDSKYDVAIIAPQKKAQEIVKVKNLTFPMDMFDDTSSIIEGRGVLIPGYPLALGVEAEENHPVIRLGIVAQYSGKDHFLIDGFASHGNSGSPVFTFKYNDRKLIGMITSYVTDYITLFDERGRVSAKLPYNSGLARALNSKVLKELLDKISN